VIRIASGFHSVKAFTGPADHFLHESQWQYPIAAGSPVTVNWTAPQKHDPLYVLVSIACLLVLLPPRPGRRSIVAASAPVALFWILRADGTAVLTQAPRFFADTPAAAFVRSGATTLLYRLLQDPDAARMSIGGILCVGEHRRSSNFQEPPDETLLLPRIAVRPQVPGRSP
jgi:hypothetical protein